MKGRNDISGEKAEKRGHFYFKKMVETVQQHC